MSCSGGDDRKVRATTTTSSTVVTQAQLDAVADEVQRLRDELVKSNIEQERIKREFTKERASRSSRATQAPRTAQVASAQRVAEISSRCGGDLPPCYVMRRESGGDIRVWNGGCYAPVGWTGKSPCGSSSASGKWQFVRGTWNYYGGYLNAADAPEDVQDAKARAAWAGGRGCGHWNACG